MSTEYRRGIPSVAHIEAATRLGLEWEDQDQDRWRFEYRNEKVWSDVAARPTFSDWSPELHSASLPELDYRPIRTDGTPVDWEVLDAEVARVAQPADWHPDYPALAQRAQRAQRLGWDGRGGLWRLCAWANVPSDDCAGPNREQGIATAIAHIRTYIEERERLVATVTPTAPAAPTTQPQGFRADLYRRLLHNLFGSPIYETARAGFDHLIQLDILTRWAVYQELKPLYDIVDGAQGEVAMPRDVEAEWCPGTSATGDWILKRNVELTIERPRVSWHPIWRTGESPLGTPLRNFAAVLDAVAEQRVAARQGQANPSATLRTVTAAQPAAPEPRSFADVRPDRHVHKRWRLFGDGCGDDGCLLEINSLGDRYRTPPEHRWWEWASLDSVWLRRTVIPTDEQGNPVSWESINETARILQTASSIAQQASQQILGSTVTVSPTTGHVETPLPRFTDDELDDVDHSATTTQDSAILKRGKLPTVEAIGKYREVMAKRNGTVAEAVKAAGIDCEVAQYVLERWAGGLSDREAEIICDEAYGAVSFTRADIAKRLSHWFAIRRPTLDTSEPADTAAQRQRAEAAERKARMAALQAQLAKERATLKTESIEEPTRFSLLEVDEAADPSKSIEAWKAQRAANERRARNTVHHVTVPTPQPAPKRKPFEVVDVEADGLSGGTAFAVLLSRAMNQNC